MTGAAARKPSTYRMRYSPTCPGAIYREVSYVSTSDIDIIRARHVERFALQSRRAKVCDAESMPWPCDTAIVLAALDDCNHAISTMSDEMGLEIGLAIEREARLRAAAQDYIDHDWLLTNDVPMNESERQYAWKGYEERRAALRAALATLDDLTKRYDQLAYDSGIVYEAVIEVNPHD